MLRNVKKIKDNQKNAVIKYYGAEKRKVLRKMDIKNLLTGRTNRALRYAENQGKIETPKKPDNRNLLKDIEEEENLQDVDFTDDDLKDKEDPVIKKPNPSEVNNLGFEGLMALLQQIIQMLQEILNQMEDPVVPENEDPNDLMSFLDEEGNLPTTLHYVYTKEGQAQMAHDKILLDNFYELEPTNMKTGGGKYVLNDFGKQIAGEDGVISKEELMKLDMDGDGKITQEDIDKYKASLKKEDEGEDLTESLLKSLDEDGFLPSQIGPLYKELAPDETPEDKYGDLVQFFEKMPDYSTNIGVYRLDEFGRALAGEDGKITKEELMKLDMNGDGKITQDDIDKFKADLVEKKATDVCTFLDSNENLPKIKSYLQQSEANHDNLLLSNFYEEIPRDAFYDAIENGDPSAYMTADGPAGMTVDGEHITNLYHNFKLNDFGKQIAGEDGVISKEELMKLDMDGDGKITQEDIDKYKNYIKNQEVNFVDFVEENLALTNVTRYYTGTEKGLEAQKKMHLC